MKGLSKLLPLAVLLVPGTLYGQTFAEYLKLRKELGISQAASSAALESFVGERTMEVKGVAKGAIGSILILDNPNGGREIYVRSQSIPDWLKSGSTNVRLLVKAARPGETSMITADLLGAAQESEMAAWESEQEARRQTAARRQPAPRPRGTAASRSTTRNVRTAVNPRISRGSNLSAEVRELIPVYAQFIREQNRRLSVSKSEHIAETLLEFSVHFGVDARLIVALVMAESTFNTTAVSHAGARGLGQLMPGTARMLGVRNSFDVEQNLYGTVKLISQHLDKYTTRTGDTFRGLMLALAAYNAGPGAVSRHGGVPPFRETQNYVRKVIENYRRLTGES